MLNRRGPVFYRIPRRIAFVRIVIISVFLRDCNELPCMVSLCRMVRDFRGLRISVIQRGAL